VDGTLDDDATWDVKLHLSSCAVCARAADELRGTIALLKSLPRGETPADFEDQLTRRLADIALQPRVPSLAERLREWWARPRVRPAMLATAGALAAVVPAALFLSLGRTVSTTSAISQMPPAIEVSAAASQRWVEQCLNEHSTYAAAEPFGDQSAVVLASFDSGSSASSASGGRR